MRRTQKYLAALMLGSMFVSSVALAAVVSQGYKSSQSLAAGTLVSVDSKDPSSVLPTNPDTIDNLVGVIATSGDSSLSVSSADDMVQVIGNGVNEVIVTDAGGPIKVGDYLTVSLIAGVASKAASGAKVIGTAQADFTGQEPDDSHRSIADSKGKNKSVAIGRIPVLLTYSLEAANTDKGANFQQLIFALTGHSTSPTKSVMILVVFALAVSMIAAICFSAVRSSMQMIGRNPLAGKEILVSLRTILGTSIGIAIAATLIILLLLL